MSKLFEVEKTNTEVSNRRSFQTRIGYTFNDEGLLIQALTHSSYANEQKEGRVEDYERLEFLGDAVLEVVASDYIYHNNPEMREGQMTKRRACIVCEPSLAHCAADLNIGECLLLGKGEDASGGRKRDALIADVMEALIGAIYLDGGYEAAKTFIMKHILEDQAKLQLFYDSKSELQVLVQGSGMGQISYRITGMSGPEHRRIFTSSVLIGDVVYGEGKGSAKKIAEQEAAYQALLRLSKIPPRK